MKDRKSFLAAACLVALAITSLTFAQTKESSKGPLTGSWDCIAHLSGEDDIPFTMTLEQAAEVVTGSVATHDGELEIKSGSFKDGNLELHLESPDAKYVVTGKLAGDQFKGQWSKDPDGMGGDWEGKKSASTKSASK